MSKVALRAYTRDIEALIDQNHLDEAIAHCQHVLKKYPKYLEIYRLLGKAYLEARRFGDAADVFLRALLAVPDDFVSHLGMSIIYDEQKDLDKALWHMERAYEAQPSNPGVQSELRRLYGRRDGLEPPKIRLTRGALAQMYTKGGQYQQAIAEINSVTAEDPNRNDLKILLARAYFHAGMKSEAIEICTDLLKQYPYTLDANRILIEILPGTSLAGSLDQYKRRVYALDPYAALVTGSLFDSDRVPDNSVLVDRLDFDSSEIQDNAWQPPASEAQPQPTESVPDWMQQAGWEVSSGQAQEYPADLLETQQPEASQEISELVSADIPDWLKAMAPPEAATQSQPATETSDQPSAADLDWLTGLGAPLTAGGTALAPADEPAISTESIEADQTPQSANPKEPGLDWLNDPGELQALPVDSVPQEIPGAPRHTAPLQTEEPLPDWLMGATNPTPAPAPEIEQTDLDWLNNLGISQTTPENSPAPQPPTAEVDIPDWLGEPDTQAPAAAAPQSEQPDLDWLNGLGLTQTEKPATESTSAPEPPAQPPAATVEIPDWLTEPSTQAPDVAAPQSEQPDLDWLSELGLIQPDHLTAQSEPSLAAESPAPRMPESAPQPLRETPAEETDFPDWISSPSAESEMPAQSAAISNWLSELSAETEETLPLPETVSADSPEEPSQPPAPFDDSEPAPEPLSSLVSGPGTSPTDQDDALNWLEALAMKQGAKPEELITQPEQRSEEIPDWVNQLGETAAEETQPPAAETTHGESPALTTTEAWLADLEKPVEQPSTPMPWEQEAPLEADLELPWEPPAAPPQVDEKAVEPFPWEQPDEEKTETTPPWETAPELLGAETPAQEPGGTVAPPTPPAAESDVDEWLRTLNNEPPAPQAEPQPEPAANTDLPNWLQDMSADEQIPQPAQVSEWLPVEEISVEPAPAAEESPIDTAPAALTAESPLSESTAPLPDAETPPNPAPTPEAASSPFNFRPLAGVSEKDAAPLLQARAALLSMSLVEAMGEYEKVIKKGKLLEEIIYDLKEVIDKLTEDTVVWQALGDAYMRANRLQEALDAYNKAEENISK